MLFLSDDERTPFFEEGIVRTSECSRGVSAIVPNLTVESL
jgi:hypothetical protein